MSDKLNRVTGPNEPAGRSSWDTNRVFIKAMLKELYGGGSDVFTSVPRLTSVTSQGVWIEGTFIATALTGGWANFKVLFRHKDNADGLNFRVMWTSAYSRRLAKKHDLWVKLEARIVAAIRRTRDLNLKGLDSQKQIGLD